MNKQECIEKLNLIVSETEKRYGENCDYKWNAVISDWNNYGKSRTYFSVIETREGTKHYKKADYGYFDNVKNEYVPVWKYDLNENSTVTGYNF